jgi:Na+/pantothenate symporter
MLLTIVNLINYILNFGYSFHTITLLAVLIYIFIFYYFRSSIKTNKIVMTTLFICIIIDLFCIIYIYTSVNENNKIINNINKKLNKPKEKEKEKIKKKSKKNKKKSKNIIKTYKEDALSTIETYETII